MKNKTFLFCCLLIFSFLSSCSQNNEFYSLKLNFKRHIEIPVDDQTSTVWIFQQVVMIEEEEYLAYHDPVKTKERFIHFAHLQDSQKSFRIGLSVDGPDGVGDIWGFHVRNLDSIFVLNRYRYELNLVDSSGRVKDRYRLRSDDSNRPSEYSSLPAVWTNSPILDLGKKLIIPSSPDIDPFKKDYKQENLAIVLDLETKEIDYNFGFTDKYFNSGFWGLFLEMPSYAVNYNDSLILQSFPIEDRVMVYDFDFNLLQMQSLFGEFYTGKFHSLPDFNLEREIFYTHTHSNPRNYSILYDPYRRLYYRTMLGPYPPETLERIIRQLPSLPAGERELPDKIIMVFDKDFNELGYLKLDRKKYILEDLLVVQGGLLIHVDTENEDKNVFEIVEVEF